MYRVITTYRNGSTHPVVEKGPWHPDRYTAEQWAEELRSAGYHVRVETQRTAGDDHAGSNDELANALASMA